MSQMPSYVWDMATLVPFIPFPSGRPLPPQAPMPMGIIHPLNPRGLSQLYLDLAVDWMLDRFGPPPTGTEPAVMFLAAGPLEEAPAVPGLRWLTLPTIHRSRDLEGRLLLGAWCSGGFLTPIAAPGRVLPGRCPMAWLSDGRLPDYLLKSTGMTLGKPLPALRA